MRHLKILPIIAIALLAACKSTVPQTESLLEEHVSTAQENRSSSAEMSVKSEKDSTVIFDRIKNYVIDSVKTDMTTNFTVEECICCHCAPSTYLWGEVQYDSTQIHLDMTSSDRKYHFNLNIKNGIAFVQKTYTDYNKEKVNELCTQHKNDSTKQNVACDNNTITFTFNDDFSGYDLRTLGKKDFEYECFDRTTLSLCHCDWLKRSRPQENLPPQDQDDLE